MAATKPALKGSPLTPMEKPGVILSRPTVQPVYYVIPAGCWFDAEGQLHFPPGDGSPVKIHQAN